MTGARRGPRSASAAAPAPAPTPSPDPAAGVLAGLPPPIRTELISELNKVERNYRDGRWEPASLDAGRLCEIVYAIVRGHVDGAIPQHGSKPQNLVAACQSLEQLPGTAWPRSIRVQIPRVILAACEVRNNRDVGHVGGDVTSNAMDAALVLATSKWLVAELVRIFHGVDTSTATEFVEALVERETPAVWEAAGTRRVLNPGLSMTDRTLLLLHSSAAPVSDRELCRWTEHTHWTRYRTGVLGSLHAAKLVEYDTATGIVYLSPTGVRYVEQRLPSWLP